MKIKRYSAVNLDYLYPFGEGEFIRGDSVDWAIGKGKIGLGVNERTRQGSFTMGILSTKDQLVLSPSRNNPSIYRIGDGYSPLGEGESCQVRNLLHLILDNEVIHLYPAHFNSDMYIAFDLECPSKEFYDEGADMNIKIDSSFLWEVNWVFSGYVEKAKGILKLFKH